jgi:hypothetical protein
MARGCCELCVQPRYVARVRDLFVSCLAGLAIRSDGVPLCLVRTRAWRQVAEEKLTHFAPTFLAALARVVPSALFGEVAVDMPRQTMSGCGLSNLRCRPGAHPAMPESRQRVSDTVTGRGTAGRAFLDEARSVNIDRVSMSPRIRKLALTSHVTFSVGWLGAVLAYLVVAIAGLTSLDLQLVKGTYTTMQLMASFVIVPCAVAALLSGLVQSLGTEWGLLRHHWIVAKFVLTTLGTVILLLHAPRVSEMAARAAETAFVTGDHTQQRTALVVHASGGLAILLAATVLSVFKPWGKTGHGKGEPGARKRYLLIGAAIVLGIIIVLHLAGGAPRH